MPDECICSEDEEWCDYCERWDSENCVCQMVVNFPCSLHSNG